MIAAMVSRFSFRVAPRMGSPEVGAGWHPHSAAVLPTGIAAACWQPRHPRPLPFPPASAQDVRAAEVNRLTLQSGKGVWLLLEPRDAAQGAAAQPAVAGAVA